MSIKKRPDRPAFRGLGVFLYGATFLAAIISLMAKKQNIVLGLLIILSIPFILLYQLFGAIGLIIFTILAIGMGMIFISSSNKKEVEALNTLVREYAKTKQDHKQVAKVISQLYKRNFQHGQLVRSAQIIGESIDIALTSKKKEIAESRMNLAQENFLEIINSQMQVLTDETISFLKNLLESSLKTFHTEVYINLAKGSLEKLRTLKTDQSKFKYINLAKEAIEEGLRDEKSNKVFLEKYLKVIEASL
ncbi:MAG: hypothetical protein EXS67_02420 [Candidatus Margulisbacteria bacterium]|nr:hypothetical protein [Candidatus Margulisiibacteriota bacterium]